MEYEDAKTKIMGPYILQLTIFSYIWSGFEIFLKEILKNNDIKNMGKINATTLLLLNRFRTKSPIIKFSDITNLFLKEIKNSSLKQVLYEVKIDKFTSKFGIPLKIIYKLRNQFVHGQIIFPEPENYSFANTKNLVKIIKYSSTIVLLYIQALLILFLDKEKIEFAEYFENGYIFEDSKTDKIDSKYVLERFHFVDFDIPKNNELTLFL